MSGSGGFYKYRCKNFLTHNCPNWVYVNNSPCAMCCAEGRDSAEAETLILTRPVSREICVPRVCDGTLQYMLMELVESGAGNYWAVRYKMAAQALVPAGMSTTEATPRPVLMTAGAHRHMGY